MSTATPPDARARADARPLGRPPSWPSAAGAVARAQLARLARDRTTVFFIVAVPALLTLLLGLALGNDDDPRTTLGVVVEGTPDEAAQRVLDGLADHPALAVSEVTDAAELGQRLRRGSLSAGVEVPGQLGTRLAQDDLPVPVAFQAGAGTGGAAARALVEEVLREEGASLGAATFAAAHTGATLEEALEAADGFGARPVTVDLEQRGEAGQLIPGGFSHTAPANLVLFVFLNTLIAGATLTEARSTGVARRQWASPAAPSAVLAGEVAAKLGVALVQAALLITVAATLFDVDWGDPLGVAAVTLLFALAAGGAAVVLGSLARTSQQVTSLVPGVGIALAALGGALWPIEVVPDWLADAALATPHGWAMRAYTELVSHGASIDDLGPELIGLGAFAAALLLAGLLAGRVALRRT